ncbi:MAG: DUF1697 domain-containing protein [Fulvivirga sp.]|uniref:DUF1697 domain-containing protein n=1 Tax=Fulvivirga sp. TaxID=1931237 RepID=UPI0032F09A40
MKHVCLLRGVNVSGSNKIKMAELREALESEVELNNVQTYIQSGNIILDSELDKNEVSKKVHQLIKKSFGFDVPVLTLSQGELKAIKSANPYSNSDIKKQYFVFLYSKPKQEDIENLTSISYTNEEFTITNTVVYYHPKEGYGKAKLSNNVFENKLKVTATARNLNTLETLIKLAQ